MILFCFLGKTCKVAILTEVLLLGMDVVELMRKCVAFRLNVRARATHTSDPPPPPHNVVTLHKAAHTYTHQSHTHSVITA